MDRILQRAPTPKGSDDEGSGDGHDEHDPMQVDEENVYQPINVDEELAAQVRGPSVILFRVVAWCLLSFNNTFINFPSVDDCTRR